MIFNIALNLNLVSELAPLQRGGRARQPSSEHVNDDVRGRELEPRRRRCGKGHRGGRGGLLSLRIV